MKTKLFFTVFVLLNIAGAVFSQIKPVIKNGKVIKYRNTTTGSKVRKLKTIPKPVLNIIKGVYMARGGNEHFYLNTAGSLVVGYIESLNGTCRGLFKGKISYNGNFTGKITSHAGCSISNKGIRSLRFKFRNGSLHMRTATGRALVLNKMPNVNSAKMKYIADFFPKNKLDVAGYWKDGLSNRGEVMFLQHLNGDSIIGIKRSEFDLQSTHFNMSIVIGRIRNMNNSTRPSSLTLVEIPIARGNASHYRNYKGIVSSPITFTLNSNPRSSLQSAPLQQSSGKNWTRRTMARKVYIDIISLKQISKDACNEKLDYMGNIKSRSNMTWLWKYESNNIIKGLKESPGVNKFLGTHFTRGGKPRVLSSTSFKMTADVRRVANAHFSIDLIDDDDMACGGRDDKIDINPENKKTDLAFFDDYYGNVQRISGNRTLDNPRAWSRLLIRIGRVGQVITTKGTEL